LLQYFQKLFWKRVATIVANFIILISLFRRSTALNIKRRLVQVRRQMNETTYN